LLHIILTSLDSHWWWIWDWQVSGYGGQCERCHQSTIFSPCYK